ncbi:unnamed protein product [Urochloa humidicola]
MENPDTSRPPVRRVKCPRCHGVLEEPAGAPVYQCGGCGTTLRAKNRTGNTGDAVRGSPSTSTSAGLPPQSRHLDSTDVASTSKPSTPTSLDATTSRHRATDAATRYGSGDLVSAGRHGSGDAASTSSTPTVTSSRRQGTGTRSQGESGDLVSARRPASGDVASTSSNPTVTSGSRQGIDTTTSRRDSGYLVSARRHDSGEVGSTCSTPIVTSSRLQGIDTTSRRESGDLMSARGHDSGEVANTSIRRQDTDTTNRRESGDLVSATSRVSEKVAMIEKRGHDHSAAAAAANQEVFDNSQSRRPRNASGAECSVHFPRENRDAGSELQDDTDAEKRMKRQPESPDAARKKHSGEATVQPQYQHHRQEPAQVPAAQSASEVLGKDDDAGATAAAGEKALSPSRHELQAENLAPLRKKILKTVDELKGDLSELFRKSPELNPTPRARPLRLPKQEGYVSRAAVASGHRVSAARAVKHVQVTAPPPPPRPPRGLPSRRYRRCRADSCYHSVQCHHGCCHHQHHHHGKPECSSCRGHCCRPRAPEQPSSAPRKPAAKRRPAPRNHCRPVLKGAPFIVCSSCFKLVQVPADFAIATRTVRKLRCGACSTVLSYSYRDPARKKDDSLADQLSTDGSELHGGGGAAQPAADPFAPFVDGFGLSSYSTDDENPLHPSRNTSFDTMDGAAPGGVGRLHRLMGYGSASELLRRSPDLYESFSERTTPGVGHYDRKGKGVFVDDKDYDVDDDSDEEERSAARGDSRWRLPVPGMLGKGIAAPGAIRIK